MEKEQAKKILDDITKSVKTMKQHEDYICSNVDAVHMSKCLREIAKEMKLTLTEEPWKCEGMMATEISVVYEGVIFFELENYRKCDDNAVHD